MGFKVNTTGDEDWTYIGVGPYENIRVKKTWDAYESEYEYEAQVFVRPYFFGLIGKKRWEFLISSNSQLTAVGFAKHYMESMKWKK